MYYEQEEWALGIASLESIEQLEQGVRAQLQYAQDFVLAGLLDASLLPNTSQFSTPSRARHNELRPLLAAPSVPRNRESAVSFNDSATRSPGSPSVSSASVKTPTKPHRISPLM
jgi:hypothetical protein